MRLSQALFASCALALLAGCGPIRSTRALVDADVELEAARVAGAQASAPYEYTAAEVFLHKARETQGRAQYEASARYAEKAASLARSARDRAAQAPARGEEAP